MHKMEIIKFRRVGAACVCVCVRLGLESEWDEVWADDDVEKEE